jgi:thiol-disulfide isomerase/thioredoxin
MHSNSTRALTLGILSLFVSLPCWADSQYLTSGIDAFNKGNYSEAIGLLGAAKPQEFDNPVWHYYMANALVRLKQKGEALREYKMALDLAPEGQLKEYCKLAIRALDPQSVPGTSQKAAGETSKAGAQLPARPVLLQASQQPQVISVLCGCPLCARLELTLTDLQSKYGDKVKFTRTMRNTPGTKSVVDVDENLKEVFEKYSVHDCPTVLVFNSQGGVQKVFSNVIPTEELTRAVDDMAKISPATKFNRSDDQHVASLRDTVVNDYNSRVAHDQLRLDQEIKDIEKVSDQQISDIRDDSSGRRGRFGGYNSQAQIQSIQDEAKAKIQQLRDDFERRKQDWTKEVDAKIHALESIQSSKRSAPTDTATPR